LIVNNPPMGNSCRLTAGTRNLVGDHFPIRVPFTSVSISRCVPSNHSTPAGAVWKVTIYVDELVACRPE